MTECLHLRQCLLDYELASGQQINFQKPSISFSCNTDASLATAICSEFGVTRTDSSSRYLGLPALVGRNKREIFCFLKDKCMKRLQSWKFHNLSQAGREVLLKLVLQAIPSYAMMVFRLPVSVRNELEIYMNSFWWGRSNSGGNGISWHRWETLCARKMEGGVGFRRLRDFNSAMLTKQSWRLLTAPNSLIASLLKARYYL